MQRETRRPGLLLDFEGNASYASLQLIPENDSEPLEMDFVTDEEKLGRRTVAKNGEKIQMAERNKRRSIQLYAGTDSSEESAPKPKHSLTGSMQSSPRISSI
jgi:hypothetical protein